MSNNALAVYGQFDNLQRAALALYESGYFSDTKSKAQAIVKVMAGAELGIPPFASMTGINIIQGKPAIGSNLIATLVKNDPRYDYRVKVATTKECILSWFENGEHVGESTFTWEEAKTTKQWSSKKNAWEALADKHNYQNYPSDMLFARALTRGARRFAPGIFGGSPVYTADELGADTDEDGNVIEGEMVENGPAKSYGEGLELGRQIANAVKTAHDKTHDLTPPMPDETTFKRYMALGDEVYGDEWDDKRPVQVTWITNQRQPAPEKELTSSKELTLPEIKRLIAIMEDKQREAQPSD